VKRWTCLEVDCGFSVTAADDDALVEAANAHVGEAHGALQDGRRVAVEFTGKLMPFKGKQYRMTVVRDISDRKEAEARIQYLAHHDTLKGLTNRALLVDRPEFIPAPARARGGR